MKTIIKQKNKRKLNQLIKKMHPHDIIETLEQLTEEEVQNFYQLLSEKEVARIVAFLEPEVAATIIDDFNLESQKDIIDNLDLDDAADIFIHLDKQEELINTLENEEFISKVADIINRQKAAVVVEHITYTPSAEEPYSQDIFNISRASDEHAKAFKAKQAIQDYIFTDGTATDSIERRFAEDLDSADEVVVFPKLPRGPRGFYIPTPVGKYSPDWAILFEKGAVKHIYFIAET